MECEICGRKIVGKRYRILVEGSELTVCESCKDLGVERPIKKAKPAVVKPMPKPISKPVSKPRQISKPLEFEYELVENFHEIIRREREKRGWSQEELAKRIQEKVSLIRKIENAEITPEKDVIEKLERLFGIKLTEVVEEVKVQKTTSITPTLGDIVVIRRKK